MNHPNGLGINLPSGNPHSPSGITCLLSIFYKIFIPLLHRCRAPLPAVPRTALVCLLILVGTLGWTVDILAQDSANEERAALVAIYNYTGGPNWTNNTNWLSEEPLSEWYGVTTTTDDDTVSLGGDNEGLVTRLDLHDNGLTGTIPAQLGNLSILEYLRLSDNKLTGPLPQSLTKLENLEHLSFDNGRDGLCAPTVAAFQEWLQAIETRDDGPNCTAGGYTIPEQPSLTYPRAGSALDDIIARVANGEISATEAAKEAPLSRGDAVAVTLHLSGNVAAVATFLQNNGVTADNQGVDYIEAFVPIELLGRLSQQSGVLRMRMIHPPQPDQMRVAGSGPPVHGSPAWNNAGFDGRGIKVGVIDMGFHGLSDLMGTEVPNTVNAMCFNYFYAITYGLRARITNNPSHCETWIDKDRNPRPRGSHGTVVAESIVDIAPKVELYIAGPQTPGDLRAVVEWMAGEGVTVINYSMGWYFDGPGDGTSPTSFSPLRTVDYAVNRGIVWVNSAGNAARNTWFTRHPSYLPYANVIRFDGSDIGNAISMRMGGRIGAQLRWEGNWDNGAARDLDLCIGNPTTGVIERCTNNRQNGIAGQIPFEVLWYQANVTGTHELLIVHRNGSRPGWIQLTTWGYDQEHYTDNGSIGNPGESNSLGMLTVGAANWNHVDTIESYSSQGPLPDGRVKPDVVGADCGKTATWSRFCGTSQSSPHVAGMAALVRQRFPMATPAQVVAYLKDNAEQRVPSPDPNNTWGHGFAVLPPISPHAVSCNNGITVPNPHNNWGLVRDCETLLAARDPLRGSASLNWGGSAPITMWEGITLSGNPQRVTQLDLRNNRLTGAIPTELGSLASLQRLNLFNNQLKGTIPSELGNLANLRQLWLDDNQLKGTIPSELGNLASLEQLFLTGNHLTGTIPLSFTRLGSLTQFHFDQNAGLCAQDVADIRKWLNGVNDVRGPECSSDEAAKLSHFLPHIADGDGWQSTLLVTNVTEATSRCTLQLSGLDASRFEPVSTVQVSGSRATFDLQGAGAYLTWPTRNQLALASGYATLDCTAPVVAQVVFASIGSSGRPRGMATVFSSQAGTVFQFPVLTPEATLGFAIANDTNADADCLIVLENPKRRDQGRAMFQVRSNSNWAGRLLDQLVTIPSTFRGGTATVSCNQPVAMIGLHYELQPDRTIITFNTLPPAVLDPFSGPSDETAKRIHFLPHIVDGGKWQSTLLVTNVANATSQCRMQLYGLSASRFQYDGTVNWSGSTATFDLQGAGAYLTWPTRSQLVGEASGYATLDCTEPVVAQVVFASIDNLGTPTGMATVFSSQAGTVFQFPVLTPEATLGFAIANDTNAAADCRIVLQNPQRTIWGRAVLAVPSKSNWSGTLLDRLIPIPHTFRGGTATVSCDRSVAMIGLHHELQLNRSIITFSTLPPAVLKSTQSSQQTALEVLYRLAGGPNRTKRANWLTGAPQRKSPR